MSSGLELPARTIPVPTSVSVEAQALIAAGNPGMESSPYPMADDVGGWRTWIAEHDAAMLALIGGFAEIAPVDIEDRDVDGARVYVASPRDLPIDARRVILDIHGGALVLSGGPLCRAFAGFSALRLGARLWSVDYRMPPDHPYPAGLDDCVAAYRGLLREHAPDRIIVRGESAGGNLAAALILRAKDEGLPMPAGVILATPEVDLTESGDSFQTNLGLDMVLTESLMPANLLYADGHDLTDPYLSPLFGDLTGFPPTLLTSGTRDLFLSNTVRMHRALRAAGVAAELHVLEAADHAAFLGRAPEGDALLPEIARFIDGPSGR